VVKDVVRERMLPAPHMHDGLLLVVADTYLAACNMPKHGHSRILCLVTATAFAFARIDMPGVVKRLIRLSP
jgi:hypothetical protein